MSKVYLVKEEGTCFEGYESEFLIVESESREESINMFTEIKGHIHRNCDDYEVLLLSSIDSYKCKSTNSDKLPSSDCFNMSLGISNSFIEKCCTTSSITLSKLEELELSCEGFIHDTVLCKDKFGKSHSFLEEYILSDKCNKRSMNIYTLAIKGVVTRLFFGNSLARVMRNPSYKFNYYTDNGKVAILEFRGNKVIINYDMDSKYFIYYLFKREYDTKNSCDSYLKPIMHLEFPRTQWQLENREEFMLSIMQNAID